MNELGHSETNLSLLKRLSVQPADEAAWQAFAMRYGGKILAWCRAWGLQESDAADVCQVVLLKVVKEVGRFERRRGGSFRAWLKTVSHNAWHDLVTSRGHKFAQSAKDIESETAGADLAQRLEAAWDQELLEIAYARVQLRVHPKTWQAFQLAGVEQVAGEEVAEQLEMKLGAVYKAKSNVLKMLQEEIRDLEQLESA